MYPGPVLEMRHMGVLSYAESVAIVNAQEFERERARLFGLAYRLLGSAADAEDVVQDVFLRWSSADRSAVEVPGAWLARAVTNLCLSRLTSARAQRERYVGPWLPEPVLTENGALGPLEAVEQREWVSLALLCLLELLGPSERAVFVLRESFAYEHSEIANVLGISEANSRQLYRRARRRVSERRRRFHPAPEHWRALVETFLAAAWSGDLAGLEQTLAAEVTYWAGDGGGKAPVARQPVVGRDRVARFFAKLTPRYATPDVGIALAEVNGQPALLARTDGRLAAIVVFEISDGLIAGLWTLANPDKLAFANRQAGALSHFHALVGL
jgi:RNA polymerase sigma-70 factor (TIGR02957 family)